MEWLYFIMEQTWSSVKADIGTGNEWGRETKTILETSALEGVNTGSIIQNILTELMEISL